MLFIAYGWSKSAFTMIRWITGRISNQREEIKCAARWAAFLKSQGTDDYVLTILPQALTFLQWYLWTQKLCALLKQPLWYQSLSLCSLISFEIVVGSLQRYLAMSLKEQPAFRDFSMYLRSSRVRCFWLPGIYLLMLVLLLLLSEGQHEHTIYDMKD